MYEELIDDEVARDCEEITRSGQLLKELCTDEDVAKVVFILLDDTITSKEELLERQALQRIMYKSGYDPETLPLVEAVYWFLKRYFYEDEYLYADMDSHGRLNVSTYQRPGEEDLTAADLLELSSKYAAYWGKK